MLKIKWNNESNCLWGCTINDKLKVFPIDFTLMVGDTSMKIVYTLLKEAWRQDETLRKFHFPLKSTKISNAYLYWSQHGWKVIA